VTCGPTLVAAVHAEPQAAVLELDRGLRDLLRSTLPPPHLLRSTLPPPLVPPPPPPSTTFFCRAIGDRTLKPYVVATPEVKRWTVVEGRDRFLVLATDGVWDVLTNGDVAAIAMSVTTAPSAPRPQQDAGDAGSAPRPQQDAGAAGDGTAQAIAVSLVRYSLQRGSADNITALVVDLAHRSTGRATATDTSSSIKQNPQQPSRVTVQQTVSQTERRVVSGSDGPPLTTADNVVSSTVGGDSGAIVGQKSNDVQPEPVGSPVLDAVAGVSTGAPDVLQFPLVHSVLSSDAATVAGTFSPHPLRQASVVNEMTGPLAASESEEDCGVEEDSARVDGAAPALATSLRKRSGLGGEVGHR
jgi:hypothetical protein